MQLCAWMPAAGMGQPARTGAPCGVKLRRGPRKRGFIKGRDPPIPSRISPFWAPYADRLGSGATMASHLLDHSHGGFQWISHLYNSTAQGGGGSFKNRKPIGELGCCESGMAERIH